MSPHWCQRQNHREYVNSVNYKQLNGEVLKDSDLEAKCGSKTYADKNKTRVLVPCGYVANSFFNDVITVTTPGVTLNEHDISWKYDREKFNNPSNYGDPNYKWLSLFVYSCDIVATSPIPM